MQMIFLFTNTKGFLVTSLSTTPESTTQRYITAQIDRLHNKGEEILNRRTEIETITNINGMSDNELDVLKEMLDCSTLPLTQCHWKANTSQSEPSYKGSMEWPLPLRGIYFQTLPIISWTRQGSSIA